MYYQTLFAFKDLALVVSYPHLRLAELHAPLILPLSRQNPLREKTGGTLLGSTVATALTAAAVMVATGYSSDPCHVYVCCVSLETWF